jgi:hypothetical protein
MARELKDAPESRPDKYIRMIMSRGWGTGSKSLQRLDSLKGAIARDRLAEDAKNLAAPGSANKSLVRNYARLEELIDHAMMDGLPNNQPLKDAIAFSRELNKIYHKSELGPLLSKERGGAERIPAGQTVEHLLGQYEGLKAVTATGRRALIADTDSAVRQIYQEIAMADPKKGIKFVQANEREIRTLTGASADLQQSATRLSDALAREKLVGQSALQRFTKMDPQVGISRVWTDKNPAYVASGILARLRGDTDAVKGFRTGILNELLSRTQGGNLVEMAKAVKDPKIDRLLKTVLEPDSYARLNKIVDLGAELAGGNSQMLLRRIPFRGTVGIALAGRFFGALIGRELGVSTLQGQSVLANAGQKMVERVFKNIDPQTLFAKALTDPKWERLLELRVNPEPKGLRRLARYVAMLTGAFEGATQEDE